MTSTELNLYNTKIYDNIHGFIDVSNYAVTVIDTPIFHRLRYLHQLGTCYYVFPSAGQNRFEHSLGTYYLTGRLLECIKKKSDYKHINQCLSKIPELNNYFKNKNTEKDHFLDDYICELIKIAGLCHDIGHGPFSHVFDNIFIKHITKNTSIKLNPSYIEHEGRSCALFEKIVKTTLLDKFIPNDHIKFIQNLINPNNDHKSFVYQIISNSLNSIDVDKCDYIARDTYYVGLKYGFDFTTVIDDIVVIDDIICYPENMYYEISCLFSTRYRLHKQIYNHKTVVASQSMICDIMIHMDDIIGISSSINNLDKFIMLTDSYILESINLIEHTNTSAQKSANLLFSKSLHNRLITREFYHIIGTITSKNDINFSLEIIKKLDPEIDISNVVLYQTKIGFVSGDKENPLDSVYFYNKKNYFKGNNQRFTIKKERVSAVLSDTYQEYITMLFYKNYQNDDQNERLNTIYNYMLSIAIELE